MKIIKKSYFVLYIYCYLSIGLLIYFFAHDGGPIFTRIINLVVGLILWPWIISSYFLADLGILLLLAILLIGIFAKRRQKIPAISLALTLLILLSSLFIPARISNEAELSGVRFGVPIHFIIQEQ